MNKTFSAVHFRSLKLLTAALAVVMLSGCVSYYDRYYGDSGVYYAGGYQDSYYRPAPQLNPVVYPYWSLDYFYFSRYQHPYSVYVGYREPLYYPYPGWAFGGYYASHRYGYRPGFRASLGFGYPWYGFGHVAPRFSLGFFAGSGYYHGYRDYGYRQYGKGPAYRHTHRLRDIDQRLRELQRPAYGPSRASLVSRERRAGRPNIRQSGGRSNVGQPSRAALLREGERRQPSTGSIQSGRQSANPPRLQQRRVVTPRNDGARTTERGRLIRNRGNRSAVSESGSQPSRVRPDRSGTDLRRQQQLQSRSRGADQSTTSDRRTTPASHRGQSRPVSAPPPARSTRAPRARVRAAPPRGTDSTPAQQSRPDRVVSPRNESPTRSRIRTERSAPSRASTSSEGRRPERSRRPDRRRLRDRPDRLD